MGLPCQSPPVLHLGPGWGLGGLPHAKGLLPPLPSCGVGQWVLCRVYPWGKELPRAPWSGSCPGWPSTPDEGLPASPCPRDGEFISCDSLNLPGDQFFCQPGPGSSACFFLPVQ